MPVRVDDPALPHAVRLIGDTDSASDIIGRLPRKRLADLERDPHSVTYDEIVRILEEHGWSVRHGTRHGGIATKPGEFPMTIPRPHGGHLKAVYVRSAVKRLKGA